MPDELFQRAAIDHRPYQRRVVDKVIDAFNSKMHTVMVESPTGSGKTIMGLLIAKYFQEAMGWKTGWVSMRRNILAQVQKENEDKIGLVDLYPISMFDKNPPAVDLLIVDEGHHDATNSSVHLHNVIKPKKILGLTATPFRTDQMQLCFEKIIKDAGIRTLVDQGYLSPYHHYTIKDYSPESVSKLYSEQRDRWGKSLMFFPSIKQCEDTATRLKARGVRCDVVTGKTDRESQLDKFENGDLDVLVNVYVLTEGFDCPDLRTVFVRPSGKAPTIQMTGRVLRRYEGIENVNVVQCENTRHIFTRTASAERQFVQASDGWRSVRADTSLIRMVSCRVLKALATSRAGLPEIMQRKKHGPLFQRWVSQAEETFLEAEHDIMGTRVLDL